MVWKRVVCASVGLVSVTDELARCEGGRGGGVQVVGGRGEEERSVCLCSPVRICRR